MLTDKRRTRLAGAAFVLASLVVMMATGCAQFSGRVANAVYPDLDQPWESENAPTATTFPASVDIRAVIGGRGEGIGCSIPRFAEALMVPSAPGDAPTTLAFRQACVFHDFCYRHGHATYGYSKLDCDVMLQQHAYRLCRQIFTAQLSQEQCRERARVVLLGVNLFGGESFAHGHRSTFFEFDPFPQRANDFVVARLSRHPNPAAGNDTPDSLARNFSLWSFYFKEGWMIFRGYQHVQPEAAPGVPEVAPAVPFLREKVAVPPHIVRAGPIDRFVWIARRSLVNSGIYVFSADATSGVKVASALAGRMGHAGTENTKCTAAYRNNQVVDGFAAVEFDCNTSVTRAVALDCGPNTKATLVSTLSHNTPPKVLSDVAVKPAKDPCADTQNALRLSPNYLRGDVVKDNSYRFVQNDYLIGSFLPDSRLDFMALGRGHHGANSDATKRGDEFRNSTMAVIRPITGENGSSVEPIPLAEALEPLAPYRMSGESRDRVISVFAPCWESAQCRLNVRDWVPGTWASVEHPVDAGVDWLRQPAQVLAASDPAAGDLLVFSKVVSDRGKHGMHEESFVPSRVRLAYRAFQRDADGWRETHRACVAVDLKNQIRSNLGAYLVRRFFPGNADAVEAGKCADGDAATLERNSSCRAMLRDFAARWHRGQVVPGYIYKDSSPQSSPAAIRRPDAAFVFNGFFAYSMYVRSDSTPSRPWASPCTADDWQATL